MQNGSPASGAGYSLSLRILGLAAHGPPSRPLPDPVCSVVGETKTTASGHLEEMTFAQVCCSNCEAEGSGLWRLHGSPARGGWAAGCLLHFCALQPQIASSHCVHVAPPQGALDASMCTTWRLGWMAWTLCCTAGEAFLGGAPGLPPAIAVHDQ